MLLYIHIPFCDSKCSYCAFNSYVDKFHLKQDYMYALRKQLSFELKRFGAQKNSIETLFIGGGTPSTVAPHLYEDIFALLEPYFQKDAEITTEANPNSATREWLEGMQKLGVNRVSFGVQSFDADKLKLLNRAHTPAQALKAIENAHTAGYKNISMDIIYATLGDTFALLENDLKTAFSLPLNHLSAYALTIEEKTPFASTPQMAHEQLAMTKFLFEEIGAHGFTQYEISNFGTYRSKHNLGYWQYKDYIGAGAGAVGKLKNNRYYPQSNIEFYIQNPLKIDEEFLDEESQNIEKILLGLRSVVGIDSTILTSSQKRQAEILAAENKLTCNHGRYYNTDYLLADEIALFITG